MTSRIGSLLAIAGTLLALASCTGRVTVSCDYPAGVLYSERPDSLGLDEYLTLSAGERQARQRLSRTWRRRAAGAQRLDQRLQALHNAVGLAPDEPLAWLRLAWLTRWVGDDAQVVPLLEAGLAALRGLPAAQRNDLLVRLALLRAWHHYDRGEWREGLEWADRAAESNPRARETMLIRGLLLAGMGYSRDATVVANEIERIDFFRAEWRWVRGWTALRQGRPKEAAFEMPETVEEASHRAEFFADRGLIQETLGEWSNARRDYERAEASLPFVQRSCLVQEEWRHPRAGPDDPALPCWLAFDRFHVTGSPVAYAAIAVARFEAPATPAEREFWAAAALNATTICIRKEVGSPWVRAWRGRVYAQLDLDRDAERDLRQAVLACGARRDCDPRIHGWLGHILLKRERFGEALPLLSRAVESAPAWAQAWTDLGLALIMLGRDVEARPALDRALDLDPDLAVAWYNRGLMHLHAERWSEAVRDLREAARLAPGDENVAAVLERALLLEQRAAGDGDGN